MSIRDQSCDLRSAISASSTKSSEHKVSQLKQPYPLGYTKENIMTRIIKATAIAATVLVGTVSSAFAMDFDSAAQKELLSLGYSNEVVSQLTSAELSTITATLHSGSDSDARQGVRSLIHSFTN